MKARKSWREKLLDSKDLPKTMVIPAPVEVDALMRKVPRGRIVTIHELREALARKHGTMIACPMTTGIFAWIAAYAAEEEIEAGGRGATPWWRTLKTGGLLNAKYPGGVAVQRKRLEEEGHTVAKKGRDFVVQGYEKAIARNL
ncbi:MAG: MGMT family protein [Planctomycetes bacterium]|nr:MGMT family protein [Planctomycetota bacterium]